MSTLKRNPRQIFISHSTADDVFVRRLAADLAAAGWPIWLAPDNIRASERWVGAINRGLEESGLFLVVLTPAALTSPWVQHEMSVAIEQNNDEQMRIVPLLLEPCRPPALWRAYQHVPFTAGYAQGRRRLLAALAALDAGAPADRAAPAPAADPLPRDGKPMVAIPAGPFIFGDAGTTLDLPRFWIDRAPVTNAEYGRFVAATGHPPPPHWSGAEPPVGTFDQPVVHVTWYDARAYAEWAGKRLPTEAQWEKAARGTDGRPYPWGDQAPTHHLCNFGHNEGGPSAVGRYSPQGDSPFGCADMSGNVWEWTASRFAPDGPQRVLRGGCWSGYASAARVANRIYEAPTFANDRVGFRLVLIPAAA